MISVNQHPLICENTVYCIQHQVPNMYTYTEHTIQPCRFTFDDFDFFFFDSLWFCSVFPYVKALLRMAYSLQPWCRSTELFMYIILYTQTSYHKINTIAATKMEPKKVHNFSHFFLFIIFFMVFTRQLRLFSSLIQLIFSDRLRSTFYKLRRNPFFVVFSVFAQISDTHSKILRWPINVYLKSVCMENSMQNKTKIRTIRLKHSQITTTGC